MLINATLVSVQDGDTATIEWMPPHPVWHRLRLADIEAPHRDEAHYTTARMQLLELLRGRQLQVELTTCEHIRLVAFNRPLAYIWVGDTLINEALCWMGLCVAWTPRGWGQHAHRCTWATAEAHRQKLGIWAEPCHRLQTLAIEAGQPPQPSAASILPGAVAEALRSDRPTSEGLPPDPLID